MSDLFPAAPSIFPSDDGGEALMPQFLANLLNWIASQSAQPDPMQIDRREPTPSELAFFQQTGTPGYAAPDNRVVLNPSPPDGVNSDAVAQNEAFRVFLRERYKDQPAFLPPLAPQQRTSLPKSYQAADPFDQRATILARQYSGDPTGGQSTALQRQFIDNMRGRFVLSPPAPGPFGR